MKDFMYRRLVSFHRLTDTLSSRNTVLYRFNAYNGGTGRLEDGIVIFLILVGALFFTIYNLSFGKGRKCFKDWFSGFLLPLWWDRWNVSKTQPILRKWERNVQKSRNRSQRIFLHWPSILRDRSIVSVSTWQDILSSACRTNSRKTRKPSHVNAITS